MASDVQPKGSVSAGRTLKEFLDASGRLATAEQALLDGCVRGDTTIVGAERPGARTDTNGIRAAFLRFLCLGTSEVAMHEHGIRLQGAWIDGELDLENCCVRFELTLQRCAFSSTVVLRDADLFSLNLDGCSVAGISADRLHCGGSVQLASGFRSDGSITMSGTRIGGNLECNGGRVVAPAGAYALLCEGIEVGGNVILNHGFRATGGVAFTGAKVGGSLICSSGKLAAKAPQNALTCEQATIGGTVYLGDGFLSVGLVSLRGANIGRYLMCSGGRFRGGRDTALACDQATIGGNVDLSVGFRAQGSVFLFGARIGGDLNCNAAKLRGTAVAGALRADGADIKGSVYLGNGFTAVGGVGIDSARIAGSLNCGGGKFTGAMAEGRRDWAFVGNQVSVGGSVSWNADFHAVGGVAFHGAAIAGNLDCIGGKFEAPDQYALSLERSKIEGHFVFRHVAVVSGRMSLIALHVANLVDDLTSWQKASAIVLDGFRYDRFAGAGDPSNFAWKDRVKWLEKQSPDDLAKNFRSQPWEQLAKVFREAGHAEEAKEVAIARQVSMGNSIQSRIVRALHTAYGFLFGYGYRPERILLRAFVACLICTFVFALAARAGLIVPADSKVLEDQQVQKECKSPWMNCAAIAEKHTPYNSFLYSLDLILPISALDQTKTWKVNTVQRCRPVLGVCLSGGAGAQHLTTFGYSPPGVGVALLARLENLFGWLAGLVLVGLATGLVKKS